MDGRIGEFELIDRLKARAGASARLLEGIGDDASVTRAGGLVVTSVDAAVEGRHFRRSWAGPESIAAKAVGAALSDLAAMAAVPGEVYIALGLPRDVDGDFIERLAGGVIESTEAAGAVLAGGDTVSSPVLFLAVTVVGYVDEPEQLVRRSGAKPGQVAAVTGRLGGAAAGLKLLEVPDPSTGPLDARMRAALIACQLDPKPRLAESRLLAAGGAAAMIDISDGLAADLGHIATASKVKINLESEFVPICPGVAEVASIAPDAGPDAALELALAGGEDYELAVAVEPATLVAVQTELRAIGCELTRIGTVSEGDGLSITRAGNPIDVPVGHDHLS